jgi:hypothetical protein
MATREQNALRKLERARSKSSRLSVGAKDTSNASLILMATPFLLGAGIIIYGGFRIGSYLFNRK